MRLLQFAAHLVKQEISRNFLRLQQKKGPGKKRGGAVVASKQDSTYKLVACFAEGLRVVGRRGRGQATQEP